MKTYEKPQLETPWTIPQETKNSERISRPAKTTKAD